MQEGKLLSIQILPDAENPIFEQRESGLTHTTYLEETVFLSLIQQGNVELIRLLLSQSATYGIVIGNLSNNSLRQMQYWAVCCITLATRYAIQGGLDEMTAFNRSDQQIQKIDKCTQESDIVAHVYDVVLTFTELVRECAHQDCPIHIRKCLHYIDKHLHQRIRLAELSAHTNLSTDYLSKSFKKHVGKTIQAYVMQKKLEEAKALLHAEYDQNFIAYSLGFCSQTYFITCFKKAFGITPLQYAKQRRGFD